MWSILISDAAANAPSSELPGLGPYPILQMFGGILMFLVLGVGAVIWRRGETAKPSGPASSPVQVYMDGPLVEVLATLKSIGTSMERLPDIVGDLSSFKAEVSAQLRETRHTVHARMQEHTAGLGGDYEKLDERLRAVELMLARLDARLPRGQGG